ncbi:P-loop NTPase [Acholeplasma granularum]|uniref:P-loop NTPase n=1 Tax=Acholeplasma granularum TaxID=264635 RepID=UPI00046F846E|nr:P-loop NTPase [Acholeplasma granularum]
MTKLETLIEELNNIVDPSLNKTFKEAQSIISYHMDDNDVLELKIALKSRRKDESNIKLEIARLVKIKHAIPGLRVEFTDSNYKLEDENTIQYIGIISGKGGVGKSSVAANLALAFANMGFKVGIIDTDVYGSSLPSIFKLPIEPLDTSEDDELIPANYEDKVQVISPEFFMPKDQPLMWRGPMLGKLITHFFNNVLWDPETKYVFMDLPPGTGDIQLDVQTFVPDAKMILVTTPHPNASHVALKAGLGAQEIGHEILGVVENMSYYFNEATGQNEYLFGQGGGEITASKLNTELLIQIPINQPTNKETYLYSLDDMNGKLYYALAKKILEKL